MVTPVGLSNPQQVLARVVIAAAVFMSNLDLWIVNVAFVAMAHDLGGSLGSVSWVLNAYAVTLAALLVPAGRLGDRIGHRRVFLAGVTLFTVASVLCALAPSLGVLVVTRVLQAAGAAAQLPTSLALLLASVAPESRTHAARSWAAVGAVAAVCGPVFGGLLVTLSWRWVFLVNLPIGIAAVVLGLRVLPHPPARPREPLPDLAGSALLVAAVAALTGALVQAPTWGWASWRVDGLLVAAALAAVAFVRRCGSHRHPLLELGLLRIRRFGAANAATMAFGAAFAIMLLSNSLWCQDVWHYSALRTGFAMAPGPLMVPFVTAASARLVTRFGVGPVAAAGTALFAGGLAWRIAFAATAPDYAGDLLPSMLIGGIGVGLTMGTLIAAAVTALPADRSATGSGIVNSARQVASSLGVAVLVTLLARPVAVRTGYVQSWTVAIGLTLLAGVISLTMRAAASARVTRIPERVPA